MLDPQQCIQITYTTNPLMIRCTMLWRTTSLFFFLSEKSTNSSSFDLTSSVRSSSSSLLGWAGRRSGGCHRPKNAVRKSCDAFFSAPRSSSRYSLTSFSVSMARRYSMRSSPTGKPSNRVSSFWHHASNANGSALFDTGISCAPAQGGSASTTSALVFSRVLHLSPIKAHSHGAPPKSAHAHVLLRYTTASASESLQLPSRGRRNAW